MFDCAHNIFVSVAFGRDQITLSELLGGHDTVDPPPDLPLIFRTVESVSDTGHLRNLTCWMLTLNRGRNLV